MCVNVDKNSAWTTISNALAKGNLVGVDTSSAYNPYGLAAGHAHSILGVYLLKDQYGTVKNRLYRIRNPWGTDSYTGPWNDADTRWTALYKSQVPYVKANDGFFFMEDSDLIKGFYYFTINYFNKGW